MTVLGKEGGAEPNASLHLISLLLIRILYTLSSTGEEVFFISTQMDWHHRSWCL